MSKPGQNHRGSAKDVDHSPVTLPPGSFDHDALEAGLEKAATGSADDRAGHLEAALVDGNQTPVSTSTVAVDESGDRVDVFVEGGVHKIVDRSSGAPEVRDATKEEIAAAAKAEEAAEEETPAPTPTPSAHSGEGPAAD